MIEKLINLLEVQDERLTRIEKDITYLIKLIETNFISNDEKNHETNEAKKGLRNQLDQLKNMLNGEVKPEDMKKIILESMSVIHL